MRRRSHSAAPLKICATTHLRSAGCTLHISMRVFPDPPIRRFLAQQHHPTLLSNKGELIQDIFLSARAPMCARCVCPRPHATHATRPRAHARARTVHRERESLSTPPPALVTRHDVSGPLSRSRVSPLRSRAATACEGCYCAGVQIAAQSRRAKTARKVAKRRRLRRLKACRPPQDVCRPASLDGPLVHFPIIAGPCGHKVRRRPVATQCARAQRCSRL